MRACVCGQQEVVTLPPGVVSSALASLPYLVTNGHWATTSYLLRLVCETVDAGCSVGDDDVVAMVEADPLLSAALSTCMTALHRGARDQACRLVRLVAQVRTVQISRRPCVQLWPVVHVAVGRSGWPYQCPASDGVNRTGCVIRWQSGSPCDRAPQPPHVYASVLPFTVTYVLFRPLGCQRRLTGPWQV